uniref:VWFA domain-containing protein n=1 Tax=uncultured organism MedDCM-OCT-S07-C1 TaxID=743625 RepID=D6PJ48_9ZZZZ|nr:hypothetical protein [uncultured organism MedDCM-OCT-S07-C1]
MCLDSWRSWWFFKIAEKETVYPDATNPNGEVPSGVLTGSGEVEPVWYQSNAVDRSGLAGQGMNECDDETYSPVLDLEECKVVGRANEYFFWEGYLDNAPAGCLNFTVSGIAGFNYKDYAVSGTTSTGSDDTGTATTTANTTDAATTSSPSSLAQDEQIIDSARLICKRGGWFPQPAKSVAAQCYGDDDQTATNNIKDDAALRVIRDTRFQEGAMTWNKAKRIYMYTNYAKAMTDAQSTESVTLLASTTTVAEVVETVANSANTTATSSTTSAATGTASSSSNATSTTGATTSRQLQSATTPSTSSEASSLRAIRQALWAAGLKPALKGEEKECGPEDEPDLMLRCFHPWSASPKDAGLYLERAGFELVPNTGNREWTDLSSQTVQWGDILVFPPEIFDATANPYYAEHGHIAVNHGVAGVDFVADKFLTVMQEQVENIVNIDMAFVLDVTKSMKDAQDAVWNGISTIVENIESGVSTCHKSATVKIRVAMMPYADVCTTTGSGGSFPNGHFDFSDDVTAFLSFTAAMPLHGAPCMKYENMLEGIEKAADTLAWSADDAQTGMKTSHKFMVVIGDYPAGKNKVKKHVNKGKYITHSPNCLDEDNKMDWQREGCCTVGGSDCRTYEEVLPKVVDKGINVIFGRLQEDTDEW